MPEQIEFSEHPNYTANLENWSKYQALYEGDRQVLLCDKYLVRHPIECADNGGKELRALRELLTRYTNLTEPCVSKWISLFYQKPMNLEKATQALGEDVVADIDGNGQSLETFIKEEITKNYLLYGRPIVYVDADPGAPRSQGEVVDQGLRAYLEVLSPLEVKDWQFARRRTGVLGKLSHVRWEYDLIEDRESLRDPIVQNRYTRIAAITEGGYGQEGYRLVKKRQTEGSEQKEQWVPVPELTRVINSTWRELPVTGIFNRDSWLKDASEIQLELFNHESELNNILHAQAFQRIFISGSLSQDQKAALNAYIFNLLPSECTVTKIDPTDTSSLERAVMKDIDKFYKVAYNQEAGRPSDSKEAPAAESQRESKENQVDLVKDALGEIESLVNASIAHAVRFTSKTKINPGEKYVEFSRDITVEDIDMMNRLAQAHKEDMKQSKVWYQEWLKKVATRQNLPRMDEIFQEIEKIEPVLEDPSLEGMGKRLKAAVNG